MLLGFGPLAIDLVENPEEPGAITEETKGSGPAKVCLTRRLVLQACSASHLGLLVLLRYLTIDFKEY